MTSVASAILAYVRTHVPTMELVKRIVNASASLALMVSQIGLAVIVHCELVRMTLLG